MSPRDAMTVGDLAMVVREAGVRLDAGRVTATGIVARVQLVYGRASAYVERARHAIDTIDRVRGALGE